MAGEGGGATLGTLNLGGIIRALRGRTARTSSRRRADAERWVSEQRAASASPAVERQGVSLPLTTGAAFGLVRGLVAPTAPASTPPPSASPRPVPRQSVPQQIGDVLSGVVQGLGDVRWFETLARSLALFNLISEIRFLLNPPKLSALGGPMPYNFLPVQTGGGTDFFGGLGSLAGGIASVINAIRSPSGMPGGMQFAPALGAVGSAVARSIPWIAGGAGIGAAALDVFGGGSPGVPTSPFTQGATGARPTIFVAANPVTGRATWFRPAGRPILWSSDLSACRRVRKVAGRARRRLGGR